MALNAITVKIHADNVDRLEIVTQARHGRSVWLRLSHGDDVELEIDVPCIVGPVNQYVGATEKMEKLSRNEFVTALQKSGFEKQDRYRGAFRKE